MPGTSRAESVVDIAKRMSGQYQFFMMSVSLADSVCLPELEWNGNETGKLRPSPTALWRIDSPRGSPGRPSGSAKCVTVLFLLSPF